MWERIKLSKDYTKALAMVDEHVKLASKFQKHKVKQRLTKIHQYLIRMRKLRMKVRPKLVHISKKIERQEEGRERKALAAARLEKAIEGELLERLKSGTYGDIYNWSQKGFEAALDGEGEDAPNVEVEGEAASGGAARAAARRRSGGDSSSDDYDDESDSEEEEEGVGVREYVVAESDESSEESDVEDAADAWSWQDAAAEGAKSTATAAAGASSSKRKRGRAYVEVEYEVETEPKVKQRSTAKLGAGW
jgi:protein MAK16|tara:strand:- start:305 stop:1051 length:747 start_codon:yes stop_codon:yes gene_type:complete